MTILYFIIALGILVAIHEWGHFIIAKLSGVGVETFSIGFGPRIVGWRRGETDYRISIIPLGGYVKLVGEDPEDPSVSAYPPEKWFSRKPMRSRLAVVLAGPLMNIILAAVLLPVVFLVGKKELALFQKAPIVVGIMKNSPAAQADLRVGDRLLKVDGVATPDWTRLLEVTAIRPNEEAAIELERDGQPLTKTVRITTDPFSRSQIGYIGIEPQYIVNNEPIIDKVVPGTPAEAAGLREGDRIVGIAGQPVDFWSDLVGVVSTSGGRPLVFNVMRGQSPQTVTVQPIAGPSDKNAWVIGVVKKETPQDVTVHRYSFTQAASKGWGELKRLTQMTFDVLKRLLSFQLSYKSLGGPIQIAAASGAAAKSGLGEFLYFMAFLSLQLGIMNLLPIPVLDGGHVAFMTVEAVIRREIPARIKMRIIQAGMALLLGLMLLVTLHDVESVWGLNFQKVVQLFHRVF